MGGRAAGWLGGWFRDRLGRVSFAGWEWLWMRLLFAPALWLATWSTWNPRVLDIRDFETLKDPNGLAALVDLSWLSAPGPTAVAALLFFLLLILYVSGRFPLLATGGLFFIHWAAGSVASSPAGDHHATQVVGMVLLGQFAFFLWRAVRGGVPDLAGGAILWSQQMLAAAYVVAGVSKLVNSGGRWVGQVPNMAVGFSKNLDQAYYDRLQAPEGAVLAMNQWAVDFVTGSPLLARALFGSGLLIELLAFLAVFNRRLSWAVGLVLIAMHETISRIMLLNFGFNKWLLLVFFVNLPFWVWWWVRGRRCR